MTTKAEQIESIRKFFDWCPYDLVESYGDGGGYNHDPAEVLTTYAETIIECGTAIMHGPGHQSVTVCGLTGEHTEHYSADGRFDWTDKDIGQQTRAISRYIGPPDSNGHATKVTKTYRLASAGVEW